MEFKRTLNPLKSNSFFLFGARGTGKTTFVGEYLKSETQLTFDLLDKSIENRFASDPTELFGIAENSAKKDSWIVIDEVQKVPALLDIVHKILENKKFIPPKFVLTGSSARKLKHGGANLLAGRAFVYNLFPLTHLELGDVSNNLDFLLQWGSLPQIFQFNSDEERKEYLRAYTLNYLKEEIWLEHLVQNLDPFRKFLEISAQMNGLVVNYSNIATDVGASDKTVKKYFQILEDTLLGYMLESFHYSIRKRQILSPKFYFFDLGVQRALAKLLNVDLEPSTYAYGKAFEHFIITECIRLNYYGRKDYGFYFLLTKDNAEIDLVIERPGMPIALVEIKSTKKVDDRDLTHLKKFLPDFKGANAFCLSQDPIERTTSNIQCLPWKKGLLEIGL